VLPGRCDPVAGRRRRVDRVAQRPGRSPGNLHSRYADPGDGPRADRHLAGHLRRTARPDARLSASAPHELRLAGYADQDAARVGARKRAGEGHRPATGLGSIGGHERRASLLDRKVSRPGQSRPVRPGPCAADRPHAGMDQRPLGRGRKNPVSGAPSVVPPGLLEAAGLRPPTPGRLRRAAGANPGRPDRRGQAPVAGGFEPRHDARGCRPPDEHIGPALGNLPGLRVPAVQASHADASPGRGGGAGLPGCVLATGRAARAAAAVGCDGRGDVPGRNIRSALQHAERPGRRGDRPASGGPPATVPGGFSAELRDRLRNRPGAAAHTPRAVRAIPQAARTDGLSRRAPPAPLAVPRRSRSHDGPGGGVRSGVPVRLPAGCAALWNLQPAGAGTEHPVAAAADGGAGSRVRLDGAGLADAQPVVLDRPGRGQGGRLAGPVRLAARPRAVHHVSPPAGGRRLGPAVLRDDRAGDAAKAHPARQSRSGYSPARAHRRDAVHATAVRAARTGRAAPAGRGRRAVRRAADARRQGVHPRRRHPERIRRVRKCRQALLAPDAPGATGRGVRLARQHGPLQRTGRLVFGRARESTWTIVPRWKSSGRRPRGGRTCRSTIRPW